MRLRELEAEFVKLAPGSEATGKLINHATAMGGADGLWLLCPKCFLENGGRVGTHGLYLWRPHVPLTVFPKPGRWEWQGASLDDLTLFAGSSSIHCIEGCGAHFFVRGGEIVNA